MRNLFIFIFLLGTLQGQIKLKEIHAGLDWRLPESAKMADDAGYLSWHPEWNLKKAKDGHLVDDHIRYATILMPTWAELEPFPGRYNWEFLDKHINTVSAEKGCGFLLSVVTYTDSYPAWQRNKPQRDGIPDWLDKNAKVQYLSNGTVVTWNNPEFHKHFVRFLKALGEKLKNEKRMIGVLMGGLDPNHGEWAWRGGDDTLFEAEKKYGMTPDNLEKWGRTFIDAYLEAFPYMKDRLVWPCSSLNELWMPAKLKEYRKVAVSLWRYAYEKGCGGRDGGVEAWNRYVDEATGQDWTNQGYLEIMKDFSPIKENRLWYTENEVWRVLDDIPKKWRLLIPGAWYASCLRTLQMQRNWMAVGPKYIDRLEAIDPSFLRWVEKSLGQTPKTSKDAWCWLREGYRPSYTGGTKPIKNIERWITQRDTTADAMSKPAKRVDLGPAQQHWSIAKDHEFHAREPDAEKGATALNFYVSDEFLDPAKSHKVQILINWIDSPKSTFRISYLGRKGITKSEFVKNSGNEIHTAIFDLDDFIPSGKLPGKSDFRIETEKGSDCVISFIRIIKRD